MFGLGIWEVAVIIIVAIVFINPKDLPKLARKIGQWYRKLKNLTTRVSEELRELENEVNGTSEDSLAGTLRSTVDEINEGLKSPLESLKLQYKLPKLDSIMPSFGKTAGGGNDKTETPAKDGGGNGSEKQKQQEGTNA